MSNFTPLVNKTYEFEGDNVNVSFSRLKRKHMLSVMPHLSKLKDVGDIEDLDQEKIDSMNDLLNDIIDSLPEYVTAFDGLADSTGAQLEINTVVEDFYFMKLAMQIALDIIKESSPVTEGNA